VAAVADLAKQPPARVVIGLLGDTPGDVIGSAFETARFALRFRHAGKQVDRDGRAEHLPEAGRDSIRHSARTAFDQQDAGDCRHPRREEPAHEFSF
jgi:hypothetical protein